MSLMNRIRAALAISAAVLVAAATLVLAPEPAAADPICPSCGSTVTPVADGFLAQVRADSTTLNNAHAHPEPCVVHGIDPATGQPRDYPGIWQWRTTAATEESLDAISGTATGRHYRHECYSEEYHHGGFGDLDTLREFQVAPQALAQLAIDDALARVGTHTLSTSPTAPSLVGLDTWYWATMGGAPIGPVTESASVPGTTVVVTASPSNLRVDPGDGSAVIECAGFGVPYRVGGTSDCTTSYQSAGTYTVTSTLMWSGTYTVDGAGPFPVVTPVARVANVDLAVEEAQAINT